MNKIIEGMTILEQTPIKDYTALSEFFIVLGILTMVFGGIVLISFVIKKAKRRYIDLSDLNNIGTYLYIIGAVIALSSVIPFPWFYKETGRYTYKCTLEDNISANYIGDNFNIVGVEDGIWTLTDK